MDEEKKKQIKETYARAKAKGVKFYPDIVYKDMVVVFGIFLLLVGMAIFLGVANEPKADPSDSAYIPRPEWYFLFLFEMLKYFPGQIEWIGTAVIPGIGVTVLLLLPFLDRNPDRHWSKRKVAISVMTLVVIGMIALTISAVLTTPPQEEESALASTLPEQIIVGEDLYSIHCVECHGPDGEGGEIKGVEGLEGVVVKPINSQDEMYTRTDETFHNIIGYGQPDLGMPPFSKAYGGELGPSEIEYIVTFMRYTWDDRSEIPEEVKQASALPALAEGEVPSYEVHVASQIKRYCQSCHRPGKKNNEYLMQTYDEVMTTGNNAPNNIIPGDPTSIFLRVINREDLQTLEHPVGPMPPTKALPPAVLDIFTRWILGGAPNTAAEAAAKTAPPAPEASITPVPGGTSTTPATGGTPTQTP